MREAHENTPYLEFIYNNILFVKEKMHWKKYFIITHDIL